MTSGRRYTAVKAEKLVNGWHVAAVIYRIINGEPWFLLQWSRSLLTRWAEDAPQLKCVGGGRRECENNLLSTLAREIWEEIFLTLGEYDPILIDSVRSPEGNHAKFFFLVPYEQLGNKNRMRHVDQSMIDGNSLLYDLGFVHWKEAISLSSPDHSKAIKKATEMIMNQMVAYAE